MTRQRLLIGFLAAAIFLAMALPRLDAQGAQYDELHQAVGAFAWCGRPAHLFAPLTAHGVPLLNMTYSGALKTTVFGLWLRTTGCSFTLRAWRMTGLLVVAAGLLFFALVSAAPAGVIVWIEVLLLTDAEVLLGSRFDGGPIALALMIRIVALAIWFRIQTSSRPRAWWAFALGVCVGLAGFEKLSSLVLLPVFMFLVAADPWLRRGSGLAASIAGTLTGLAPLVAVNAISWASDRIVISASAVVPPTIDGLGLVRYLASYLSLGAAADLRHWILGTSVALMPQVIEGALILTLLGLSVFCVRRDSAPSPPRADPVRAMTVAYWLCLGGTALLPASGTASNHWIVGTPFQYAAFALAATQTTSRRLAQLVQVGLVVLLVARLPTVVSTEAGLYEGRYGPEWDPALTHLGQWAAQVPSDSVFIAADWGIATQIATFSNGRQVPKELFWDYRGPAQLAAAVSTSGVRSFYLVSLVDASPVNPLATERLFRDASTLPGWHEQPLPGPPATFSGIVVRRFGH